MVLFLIDKCNMKSLYDILTLICRAFDTLAKALNTADGATAENLADGMDPTGGGNIHVISRDQSTPIIEVEGPLLTDTHVTFKVCLSLIYFGRAIVTYFLVKMSSHNL